MKSTGAAGAAEGWLSVMTRDHFSVRRNTSHHDGAARVPPPWQLVSWTVTKLRLKPPSKIEPRHRRRIFVTRRPFGPQLRQLLKPARRKTCLACKDIGFRRCLGFDFRAQRHRQVTLCVAEIRFDFERGL